MKTNITETIKNPLTVIAIFAGISEVAMTITLAQLPESNQNIFIWFVMLFPILLVSMFFFVLYKKPAVLFSPSDYKKDETYLSSISDAKSIEGIDRRLQHLEEVTQTLQTYLESVVKEVSPEVSETIISEQQKRLDYIRKIHDLENNYLYSFLNREIGISPDTIIKLISKSESANKLPDSVYEITNSRSNKKRLERVFQRFPKAFNDFDKLKKEMEV